MGIRVKQFKEIDYPQPHTGKGEHNAKHKSQQNTKSRHKKNRTEEISGYGSVDVCRLFEGRKWLCPRVKQTLFVW